MVRESPEMAVTTHLLRYTRFSVNCPLPWCGSSKGSFWTTSTPSPRSLCSWLCLLIMYSCPILYYKTQTQRSAQPLASENSPPTMAPQTTNISTLCSEKTADTWAWCYFSSGARRMASREQNAEMTCSCEHSASPWQSPWVWHPTSPW